MSDAVLRLSSITRAYGEGDARVQVLMGIDLLVEPGEFLAIMGPSGSGKSTLLNILGCLDRPSSGSYFLDGEDVAKLSDARLSSIRNERIGFVFQSFNLIPQLTVLENVEVPLLYAKDAQPGRARKLLDTVGLSHRLRHRPNQPERRRAPARRDRAFADLRSGHAARR